MRDGNLVLQDLENVKKQAALLHEDKMAILGSMADIQAKCYQMETQRDEAEAKLKDSEKRLMAAQALIKQLMENAP